MDWEGAGVDSVVTSRKIVCHIRSIKTTPHNVTLTEHYHAEYVCLLAQVPARLPASLNIARDCARH